VHIKFKAQPLKQLLIAPNSQENPGKAQPAGHVCPGENSALEVSLFYSSLNKKIKHQSELNSVTFWTPNP
jgi:hypothetical protein